jgi:NAD(P)-dependent dehydrogenase (short-subunit alcohol dehydrogenase family)
VNRTLAGGTPELPQSKPGLQDRVVVVTGASAGLGRHFVSTLHAAGAKLVVTARRAERLAELADDLGDQRLECVPGDLTDPDFPSELMARAVKRFGRLDVLVNNAGITHVDPAESETTESFMEILAVNLVAPFACCREAFPYLRDAGGGSIINVGSVLGIVGIGRIPQASYCAAKGGVVNLTRELAAQWARHNIRVNCLAPGWFPSEMTHQLMTDERSMRYIQRTVPLGRPGQLEELDGLLLLLADGAGTYLTGQTIAVDGGWTTV